MNKKIFLFLIKLTTTVGLFILLFRPETYGLSPEFWGEKMTVKGILNEIRAVETHNLIFWLTFAALVRVGGIFCGVVRWRLLLKGQGLDIPFGYALQSWFVGRAIGIFLPGTIGLDGYRLYDSIRYTREAIRSVTVIIVEKLTGFIALTLLVFITFPMGYRLVRFNKPMLFVTMVILGTFVIVSLLVLLYPRVIRVLFSVLPVPQTLRAKVAKLGAAAAAYGAHRKLLLAAVFFGVLVHVAICLMFFGVMSAIRAENTTIYDIFFTSPLMIWGTVLGPSVGGEGIREVVFTSILGTTSGTTKAFLIGHLGWWAGDIVPFLIGLPIFLLRRKPSRSELQEELAKTQKNEDYGGILSAEEIRGYRRKIAGILLSGFTAGLWVGACCGVMEAIWLIRTIPGFTEYGIVPWAILWYGFIFLIGGGIIASFCAFLFLLLDRFPRPSLSFAFFTGSIVAIGLFIFGRFRIQRDLLGGKPIPPHLLLVGAATTIAIALAIMFLAYRLMRRFDKTPLKGFVAGVTVYGLLLAFALAGSTFYRHPVSLPEFNPTKHPEGPNIIFIGIDTLRADALRLYNPETQANTPNLDAFARDAVLFQRAFANACWTKPSFATFFTGLYPESHRATSKSAALPLEVTTIAEWLRDAGYYTQGFGNNPNTSTHFQFDQGFIQYYDLRPRLHFGASWSASKSALYEILRRVRQIFIDKIHPGRIYVEDFYQPAEIVNQYAFRWLDSSARPQHSPFYLFLHYMDPHDPYMNWSRPGIGYAHIQMARPNPETHLEPMLDAYRQEVEHLDRYLGELFKGLKDRGIYDDALIIVVSDHGEEFYDHRGWWHGQTLYEELLHIPLLIKLPQNKLGGTTDTHFARHIDLVPTMLAAAGIAKPDTLPGVPLVDISGTIPERSISFVYAENDFEQNDLQSVRTNDAKLILANPHNMRNLAPVELYDLLSDPKEQSNLAGTGREEESLLKDLISGMQAYIREHAAEPVLKESIPEDLEHQMRSIGYF